MYFRTSALYTRKASSVNIHVSINNDPTLIDANGPESMVYPKFIPGILGASSISGLVSDINL